MKGVPRNLPSNHVEWDNGFKSNMPDWKTAKESAAASDMLFALKEARTALLAVDVREVDAKGTNWNNFIEYGRFERILECVQKTIDKAEGMEGVVKSFGMPPPPGFPKPPGVK